MDATPATIVYYVSGHGFGHARRTAEVLRELSARASADVQVTVRTAAPASLFRGIPNVTVSAPPRPFDPGVVERSTLSIDPAASMRRLAEVLDQADEIIAQERDFLRAAGAQLVAADIPFLAGDAAEAAGVPCVAVGNFTWDWIYEPYATPHTAPLIDRVRAAYRKFESLLQLPLGHPVDAFRHVHPMPLIAGRPRTDRRRVLEALDIDPADPRPRLLVALRGGVSEPALRRAADESPGHLFLINQRIPNPPANLKSMDPAAAGLDFTDVLNACHATLSKVGYGILADCIATGVALLHPHRDGFREDEISLAECPRYLRMRELPAAAFTEGRWHTHLESLLNQPPPPETLPTDGAPRIAEALLHRLQHTAVPKGRGRIRTDE